MKYRLEIADNLSEAYAIWTKTKGTYLAAGTVILVNHAHKDVLISLERIPGLNTIEEFDDYITIGANVTFDEIENSKVVKEKARALWQASCSVGGPQIRNRATIGGNVGCFSVSSDSVTALMALEAEATVFNGTVCSQIPVSELEPFLHGEIITGFRIPCGAEASVFEKVGRRNALAVAQVNMAVVRRNGKIRIAVGCVGPKVILCRKTAELVSSGPEYINEARDAILAEINPRKESAAYKNRICVNLLEKLVNEVS